jgi:glucosylceramidase
MERVTDGTYGYEAVNATYHLAPNKILLGSEACSCPKVRLNDWLRAERLAHDIIFDLQNYAQGWIDWNLIVDYKGGPNHLDNMCDASLIALEDFSNVLIQPKFYYFGHISKYITPGSQRINSHIIGNYNFADIDPNIQAYVEAGMYRCEKSTRQTWKIDSVTKFIELATWAIDEEFSIDSNYEKKTQLCLNLGDENRIFLKLVDCNNQLMEPIRVNINEEGQLIDIASGFCISIFSDVKEPGALLTLTPCIPKNSDGIDQQQFDYNQSTGEITSKTIDDLCLTAGWPFLNAVSFITEDKKDIVTVITNEASIATSIVVFDNAKGGELLGFAIDGRSIETLIY